MILLLITLIAFFNFKSQAKKKIFDTKISDHERVQKLSDSGKKFKRKLPYDFVYLSDIDPTIHQDLRYFGKNNFTGKHVVGYKKHKCIMTRSAALALFKVQKDLKKINKYYSLKVYDSYRPQKAVNCFWNWAKDKGDLKMKKIFYPKFLDKKNLFAKGYIAKKSGHSRGSTIDLTIIDIRKENRINTADFSDNSINMGSIFDYFGKESHYENDLIKDLEAKSNRKLLRDLMITHGFYPYEKEWWHFTLKNESHPNKYFNFDIE